MQFFDLNSKTETGIKKKKIDVQYRLHKMILCLENVEFVTVRENRGWKEKWPSADDAYTFTTAHAKRTTMTCKNSEPSYKARRKRKSRHVQNGTRTGFKRCAVTVDVQKINGVIVNENDGSRWKRRAITVNRESTKNGVWKIKSIRSNARKHGRGCRSDFRSHGVERVLTTVDEKQQNISDIISIKCDQWTPSLVTFDCGLSATTVKDNIGYPARPW